MSKLEHNLSGSSNVSTVDLLMTKIKPSLTNDEACGQTFASSFCLVALAGWWIFINFRKCRWTLRLCSFFVSLASSLPWVASWDIFDKMFSKLLSFLLSPHKWEYRNPYDRTCSVCGRHEVSHCYSGEWSRSWWECFDDGDANKHK